ncbi:homogentisate phytyltransferase [Pseudanabaena sp. FACHB-2040]|uniref:homogentisate phytyltransferase n=1 Tax=Pseudanabaena sp. FACHB-2040 TaxID=2692859 RepID=UPI001687A208|nr:homogentisate phytyltransferase [Pseudanabaena sp. FACHB-2040]MBD2260909.1 homogentisate phytyltransferase [Pseudanabaena sp. FACHB-2040]
MSRIASSQSAQDHSGRLHFRQSPRLWLRAFWRFSRPHTIIGTSLSVLGLFGIVWAGAALPFNGSTLPTLLLTWLACLAGNVYIVGLNQIEDVEIDRINKPRLPLAAGEFSLRDGRWIVGTMGFLAVLLAVLGGPWLLLLVGASLLIGTAYSLPPIRLKRFPFWASFCILAVRGAIVNLGLFLHLSDRFGQTLLIPPKIWALTGFVLVFSIAIAIFKDIPDIEGDRHYNIQTFTVQLGQRPVFNLARGVLTLCYGSVILAAPWLPDVNRPFLALSHLIVLATFWLLSFRVAGFETANSTRWSKPSQPMSYPDFYQFIWKMFFLEYLLFPLATWLA